MNMTPAWKKLLDEDGEAQTDGASANPTLNSCTATAVVKELICTEEDMQAVADCALSSPITHVGLAGLNKPTQPPVSAHHDEPVWNPVAFQPVALALALACKEQGQGDKPFLRYAVVDLREPSVLAPIRALTALPVPFVGHDLIPALLALQQLGIPLPRTVWDTRIAARVATMGRFNAKSCMRSGNFNSDFHAKQELEHEHEAALSLGSLCLGTGVPCGASSLQPLSHEGGAENALAGMRRDALAWEALAVARLYPHQVQQAVGHGTLDHLKSIEMPWLAVNADMIHNGFKVVDRPTLDQVRQALEADLQSIEAQLKIQELDDFRDQTALIAWLEERGLDHHFGADGRYQLKLDRFKQLRHVDPAIELIHQAKKFDQQLRNGIIDRRQGGLRGRIHPHHRQLAADSGRQGCRWPNIVGIGRTLRPLVVPEPGNGIGEVDLCQIEVGIAGAWYKDQRLIEMFNSGDVYSAMAQHFYQEELSVADCEMGTLEFKHKHPDYRAAMKECTLGIIYGITPHGLAPRLKTTESKAEELQGKFMKMFPDLESNIGQQVAHAASRGYATTVTGLRRYRGKDSSSLNRDRNWMRNHPIQGSAAAVFKLAGIRLHKLYRPHDAKLIIPMHDAYVFEAPLVAMEEVGHLTARVMCEAVQEYFPELRPRAEININHPECWNKDGLVGLPGPVPSDQH